jgi:exonuclease SbcC
VRPLRLELKGFTAFREHAEIDFTNLDVFAISGPTGSGKSSLLDAMTYALYGRVERVGERVGQLISQGQPRMAVMLEFEVGRDRYRLTRSTSVKGPTKIQLMRLVDGDWVQAGEGSDRVRDVERTLVGTIGLTYDGFTRSVLLPQGRFAEVLVGDAKKRRDILTELLGLSLFRRMAERAGAVGKESGDRAGWLAGMLEADYAEVTPSALRGTRAAVAEARRREGVLAAAVEQVAELLTRWKDAERASQELLECAREAEGAARQASDAARTLAELAERIGAAEGVIAACRADAREADQALRSATEELEGAESTLGSQDDLSKARVWAHSLGEAVTSREAATADEARGTQRLQALSEAVHAAGDAMGRAEAGLAAAETSGREAESQLEHARRADHAGAAAQGLRAGDPCPVCGVPLQKAPKRPAAGALDVAAAELEAARSVIEESRRSLEDARRTAESAERDVAATTLERDRLVSEIAGLSLVVEQEGSRLGSVLGSPLPDDPGAEIDRRLADWKRRDQAERESARRSAEAERALDAAEQDRDRMLALVDRQRDRLSVDHASLFERAARAGVKVAAARIPAPPESDGAAELQGHGEKLAGVLAGFAAALGHEVDQRAALEHQLLQEGMDRVDGLVGPVSGLEALAEAVNAACRSATAEVATAQRDLVDLGARLERKRELTGEMRQLETRASVFRALALELRNDRLIAYLQAEALQLLASAGSDRLASISDGRYRLVCRDDEFSVVDTWNGDEERSVRTLSGGETFLASLALALALADQVRSLSVTDRARLDSLFLDEGFGTLDPEALRTVTDAIELLAGDGRLVGVITHVKELAEQFPRIEVRKDPAGSRLELVP